MKPKCIKTVGQLIKHLEKFPKTLVIEQGWGDGVVPVWFNQTLPRGGHLSFEENDGSWVEKK